MTSKPRKTRKTPARKVEARKTSPADLRAEVAAINRVQAIIEFKLDGEVITANDNFLRVIGYSLEEIRGKHHRMFLDKLDSEGQEYLQFWDKLRRGEFDSGDYRRVDKNGKEIWLHASYNPVFDAKGKPYKVIKFASDITASKQNSAQMESLLGALSRSQAVIEFSPEGKVLTANENLLKVMGYTLDEIKGQHHGMFVDAEYRNSGDYLRFWERLARGEFEAGQFKRIAKGGREVWLQATYNPVLDVNGKLSKVVKYAADITTEYTKRQQEAETNAAFKGALDNLLSSVMVADADLNIIYMNKAVKALLNTAEADIRKDLPNFDAGNLLGVNIDVFHRNPAHQRKMLAGLTKTSTSQFVLGGRTLQVIAGPMVDSAGKRMGTVVEWADRTAELSVEREVQEIVSAVNDGDLEKRISLDGKKGFYGNLASGINNLADNMAEVVGRVKTAAGEVTRGADEISQGNSNLSQRTEEQASSLEQTASSMEEMTSTVKQNADNAAQANQLSAAAREQAEKGGAVVGRAIKAMADINDASKKIADIIGVIDEIAFQTNLLALNAAVEAARAGEQGRGFAVVASEVRNLAGRSATAAKEIKGLIQDSVRKVEEGSTLVSQSGQTLEQIVNAVKKVSDIIAEIAAAGQEQSSGIDQVNKAIMQLDEMTQQNAALVEEASAASQSMAEQARSLNDTMARFRVTHEEQTAAVASSPTGSPKQPATASERRTSARPWTKGERAGRAPDAKPAQPRARAQGGAAVDTDWQEF